MSAPKTSPSAVPKDSRHVAQHFRSLLDLNPGDLRTIFDLARELKRDPAAFTQTLKAKAIVLLFEKPSLRTRVSFEIGAARLGAAAVFLDHTNERIGQRECVEDYARNLDRWADAIVARTYAHETINALAASARVPVINALSNARHPCQALADYFTLAERFGDLRGLPIVYIGDGNNVCHSLLLGAGLLGVRLTVVCPPGFEPAAQVVRDAAALASGRGGACAVTHDIASALPGARAVYTDVWTSMGQDAQAQERRGAFRAYQVTQAVMAHAAPDAIFMHCLPAHRGEEVAAAVIDSPVSVVYDQAENRMHTQNALMLRLLSSKPKPHRRATDARPTIVEPRDHART